MELDVTLQLDRDPADLRDPWPFSAIVRRHYRQAAPAGKNLLVIRVFRLAAIIDLLYLVGWLVVLRPILDHALDGLQR